MGDMRGTCHCGRVTVTMPEDSAGVVACHCTDCVKLHGNFFALLAAERGVVRWTGEEHIRWYRSSEANERSFCGHCGSRLAKRPVDGTRIMVSAGLFEGATARTVVKNLWTAQAPAWSAVQQVGPMTPQAWVALALSHPIGDDQAQFGYAMRAASGNPRPPGVMALTWIAARDPGERDRVRAHSRQNLEEFRQEPGFISMVTGFTGLRGFTVTAWEDESAMKRALSRHHAVAMKELLGGDFVASVWTSVWTPARLNRMWQRCTSCGALEDVSAGPLQCTRCQADLPPQPAYW